MDPDRYAAFLSKVIADPESDAPRLVLADALEEAGDGDQAELIRTQVALARDPGVRTPEGGVPQWGEWRERVDALRRREAELLTGENFWRWFDDATARAWPGSPLARVDPPEVLVWYGHQIDPREWRLGFRRGFIEHAEMTAADWLAHGPAVVRATPLARVTLSDKRPRQHPTGWHFWQLDYNQDHGRQQPWHVPYHLFKHMPDAGVFDTEQEATAAISTAALAFARAALPAPAGAR